MIFWKAELILQTDFGLFCKRYYSSFGKIMPRNNQKEDYIFFQDTNLLIQFRLSTFLGVIN